MEIGGGNIVDGPRQYLQGTVSQPVGGSAAAPTTANTCNNLPPDNARTVAMETTSNPLSYWPPPSSDSPLTNNSKDAGDNGSRKLAPLSDHSYNPDSIRGATNWTGEKAQADKGGGDSPAPSDPLPKYPSTHNLPPIAAITSSHNYRGVREAAQKHAADTKSSEAFLTPPQQQADGRIDVADKSKKVLENEDVKPEERTQERPKTANSEYVFSIPNVVHSHSNGKTMPVPRTPTPFSVVTSANSVNNHQYHSQPEALTLNISTTSALSSGSSSPSGRIAPSPHFLGPSPNPNRLPTPNVPSPSESPRVLPSPHSNVPSPSSTSSRLHSSPHLNLPSPSADNSSPTTRIPSSPQPHPPPPPLNSVPPGPNRYGPALPYPTYPYLNTPRSNAKSIPVQSIPVDRVEPRKVVPNQSVPPPIRSNQNDTHTCRNPFELPVSKPYPQQQSFQHYTQVKPASYYPCGKPGEKDYEAYKRTQQHQPPAPAPPKGIYPMDTSQYGHPTSHHHHQQQPQHQQHPPSPLSQSLWPPTHELQREFVNTQRHGDLRTWTKSDPSDMNQKGLYLNTQNRNNFSKVNYAGNEYHRMSGEGYTDMHKTMGRQTNGAGFGGVSLCNTDKNSPKPSSQTNSHSQRFPPVPQSNYDLNRQIYDRMTGNNQQQMPPLPLPQQQQQPPPPPPPQQQQQQPPPPQQQQRTEKPMAQMGKPQVAKPHPYYRDYPIAADKDKPKTPYQEYQPNTSRPYGQYNFQVDETKAMETYPKRVPNPAYPFNAGDTGMPHQVSDHHRPVSQTYGSCTNQQVVHEVAPTDYDKARFINPQTVQPAKNRNLIPAVRPKRESPLDLSVKTVRQSADSTAKDDGDVYSQNFRGFMGPEGRYQMSNGPASAPKIDFTPNFSGFHAETQPKAEAASSVLPPVESFKKLTPKSNHFDGKGQTFAAEKPVMEPSKYSVIEHHKSEAQKRPSNDPIRSHSSQPKLPKIDAWRLAMDQQIEQRLNSARHSQHQASPNGVDSSKSAMMTSAQGPGFSRQPGHIRDTGMYPRPPVQTSAAPYNPSSYLHQPQCQPATPQTPQDNIPHRDGVGHSPDPEQIIKQISKGVMPDHKLLQDKNVVSILRSSLEEKEAKLIQLREAARRKERLKEQEAVKKVYPNYEQMPRTFPPGKQSLPPFGAITLERMCAPPSFPGHKLNVPRSIDTVKIDIEPTQNYLSPAVKHEAEKSGIPSIDLSPQDDAQGPPTDLDGLAAFLAARIRTKAELKQVGPSLDNLRALSSHQSPKASGVVSSLCETPDKIQTPGQGTAPSGYSTTGSPPKLTRESRLLPPFRRRLFSHTEEESSMATVSSAQGEYNQPQPVRIPPRDPSGIRSSSETSVFDFRESDSEGEMPVLERQTLEGMRRDRKTFGSKQNVSTTTPDEPGDAQKPVEPEKIAELETSEPDPFWNTAFDMFVEQLEKRPPKRSVRKKKPHSRPSLGPETKGEEPKVPVPGTSESAGNEEIKTEPKEESCDASAEVKVEPESENVEKHEKLSASRLRVYRNEMLIKESKEKEESMKLEEKEVKMVTEEGNKEDKSDEDSDKAKTDGKKEGEKSKKTDAKSKDKKTEPRNVRVTRATSCSKEDSGPQYDSDIDLRDLKSDSSSVGDDDDSVSISGMESESTESDSNDDSSNANFTSDGEEDDSDSEGSKRRIRMQTRMQTRTSRQLRTTGMRLRSKAVPLPKATLRKCTKRKRRRKKKRNDGEESAKKKKPSFGDGSHFRPGWEEECYKFKQQLRMPEKLISISRPPKRSSASLPDLDPYRNSPSMSLDSSDVSLPRKSEKPEGENDGDEIESKRQKRKSNDASSQDSDTALTSLFTLRNGKKSQTNSILNMLVNKYGRIASKKQRQKRSITERKSPRILPKGSDKPELLPTPSLGIGKENVLKDKRKGKDSSKKKLEERDSIYLGYFRQKTVNNFKEAFKEKGGMLLDEFCPEILKSRTRMQTKVLKKRATLMEVFGEERPASAPPLSRVEDGASDAEKPVEKKKVKPVPKKMVPGVVTRGKGMLTRSGRPGLRSAAVLRSNKAVQISKRHLNSGRQQRSIDLLRLRAMANKKFRDSNLSCDVSQPLANQKRLKLRSVRRKFRSGFDYIRKKKKMKKDGDSVDGSIKEKKISAPRPNSESIADIQSEIKNWVINKGLGETILHRAARLGYTDVAAYCLEKMDCSPSPRDNAGYTPLHEACSRGHLDIAKLLLMYGASVSESAKGGIRPLHEAAENGYTELIRLLLSYGADPLLETYTGHTALSLVTDEDARRLIQHHLADIQGNVAPAWSFLGPASLFDPSDTGCDPLADPPSPESTQSEFELEVSDMTLPPLYRLADDYPDRDPWVLVRDLVSCSKVKSREALLKQLNVNGSSREMKHSDFSEQAKCLNLLGTGERAPAKASKVVLIPYDEKVRQLLSVERVLV